MRTASGLDRDLACPGSMVLPRHPHRSDDTDFGTVAHRFLDRVTVVGRERALGEIEDAEDQARCAAIDLDAIPAGAESEVAFAYDPEEDRAERLALPEQRAYPRDGRFYGTADRVGLLADGRVYVGDFKTGKTGVLARYSMQLRFLALAAARVAGADEASVSMLYLRSDGRWYEDRATFDALDLDEVREQLLAIRATEVEARRVLAAGGLPQLVPGVHCEHCAAAPECPAQERLQRRLVELARDGESNATDLDEWIAALPELEAGAIVERAIVVAKIAENVRSAANARVVAAGDLVLPSGRRLKRVAYHATKRSPVAKEELAALTEDLRSRGEITSEATWQVRVVGASRRPAPAAHVPALAEQSEVS